MGEHEEIFQSCLIYMIAFYEESKIEQRRVQVEGEGLETLQPPRVQFFEQNLINLITEFLHNFDEVSYVYYYCFGALILFHKNCKKLNFGFVQKISKNFFFH